jgi:hypothetical protein
MITCKYCNGPVLNMAIKRMANIDLSVSNVVKDSNNCIEIAPVLLE